MDTHSVSQAGWSRSEIQAKVKRIILERIDVPEQMLSEATSLTEDLNVDSLDALDLLLALEDAFDLEISDEDAARLITLQATTDYLMRRLADPSRLQDEQKNNPSSAACVPPAKPEAELEGDGEKLEGDEREDDEREDDELEDDELENGELENGELEEGELEEGEREDSEAEGSTLDQDDERDSAPDPKPPSEPKPGDSDKG